MLPLPRGAAWQALFILCAVLFINGVHSEGRVVCYYTNWSVYRPGTAKFNPQNINPYLCTHLVYAFGGFTKDNQMKPFDKYQDVEQGGYAKFTGLKTYNKQLKTMIAIGGWNEASTRFSPLMANPERRHQFIKNILKFLRQNHFDGIDLDWEYPAHREGGKPRDKDNYAQFVQELRAEFEREAQKTGRPRLLITMAVPAGIEYIEKGYDIPKLNKYLDWFNVLTYDFHSSHEPSVNHHAPLYSIEEESEYNYDAELNIDYAIKFYLKAGADRDKLVLGIPTYGRTYTLINEESTELGAPSEGPGEQGDATREKGYLAYYEICQAIKDDPEWTIVQPNPKAMGPYAYRRNQWVGYDDEDIVRKKAEYVVEHGLGGIMFWAIDNDDFRGTCTGKAYPLIEAAKAAMLESLGLGINEVAKPSSPRKPSRSRSRENSSSSRNRIGSSTVEKTVNQYKETSRGSTGRKRVKSSTTAAPSTTIKLTDPEASSLYIGGRTTTPAPPTTPDPGADFKCEEEGFFQHPRDCKKYFWCLDSGPSGLGIVAHQFTCPSGLYFNPAADSCDFARNVPCKTKKSTTAAPTTTSSTTASPPTTTRLPTTANRFTSATPRTTLFRTTTTTTTTTTPAPVEEYEDEEEEVEPKDKESEEDPKVIKELIDLIRKVGGIEELEKHLLRKEDGTISLKENDASPNEASTTVSPISKKLYDKVLSRPNTYNSFRNRFASTLKSQTSQSKNEEKIYEETEKEVGRSSTSGSKYSSVVRGNSRQGPQNEGLDKLAEFDGFLKERKQYVTINRNRGNNRQSNEAQDEDEIVEEDEDLEAEEVKSTRRPTQTATPSYTSIRRTRPTTLKPVDDEEEEEEEAEEEEVVKDKKTYTSLSRTRGRSTTTEKSVIEETTANGNKYKFIERKRPSKPTNRFNDKSSEEINTDADDRNEDEEDHNENDQNEAAQRLLGSSTQQTPTTTLTHIFTLTDDEQTNRPPTTNQQRILVERGRPKHKVVELKVESLPHVEQLGEISVVKYVHLVDGSDISVDGHSTVADYTPTDPTVPRVSVPVRNSIPLGEYAQLNEGPQYVATTEANVRSTLQERYGKALVPEVIREAVEASTISLEGLFDNARKSKELNTIDENVYFTYGLGGTESNSNTQNPIYIPQTSESPIKEDVTAHFVSAGNVESSSTIAPEIVTLNSPEPTTSTQPTTESPTKPTTVAAALFPTYLRTTTGSLSATALPRRPVLSVRRRIGNTPATSQSVTTTAPANDQTTTEQTTASKFSRNRNRATPTLIPNSSSSPSSPSASTTRNYFSSRSKTRFTASPAAALTTTITPAYNDESATSVNDITLRLQNTKYSTTPAFRRKFQARRLTTTTTAATTNIDNETGSPRTQNPLFKRRFSLTTTLAPPTATPTFATATDIITTNANIDRVDTEDSVDQVAKSSIHTSRFNQISHDDGHDEDGEVNIVKAIKKAAPPEVSQHLQNAEAITRRIGTASSLPVTTPTALAPTTTISAPTRKPVVVKRRPHKNTPVPATQPKQQKQEQQQQQAVFQNRRRPHKYAEPFERTNSNQERPVKKLTSSTHRPLGEFDYYDDEDVGVVGNTQGQQLKVILHGHGIIECLDQGNFPHPLSCRKFISCAKFETGGVVGWEYTCPKGLSYDPVGGMCNWAAGLGCKE